MSDTPLRSQVRFSHFGKLPWLPWEVLIAGLLIITGVSELISPEPTNIPRFVSAPMAVVYLLSGVLTFLGMWRLWSKVEMLGLSLLIVGVFTDTSLSLLYGGAEAVEDSLVLVLAVWAAGNQLYQLMRGRVLIQIEAVDDEH